MKKLLLVDDDQSVRRILALGLRVENYEVTQAANGHEALEHLRDEPFDVAIADLMMPVMDGRAFIQKVRQELGSDIPILVLTSVKRAGAASDLLEGGASALLNKPVTVARITEKLQEITP